MGLTLNVLYVFVLHNLIFLLLKQVKHKINLLILYSTKHKITQSCIKIIYNNINLLDLIKYVYYLFWLNLFNNDGQ